MTRQAQKEKTRARLIEVAKAEFEKNGFEKTTIAAIARGAEVAPGTVFVHFVNKIDLLHSALYDDLNAEGQAALDAFRGHDDVVDGLVDLARRLFAYFAARPALSAVLLRHSLLADGAWAPRFRAQVEMIAAGIIQNLAQHPKRAPWGADMDIPLFIGAFFSFYYFALIQFAQGGFEAAEPHLKTLEKLLRQHLRGL